MFFHICRTLLLISALQAFFVSAQEVPAINSTDDSAPTTAPPTPTAPTTREVSCTRDKGYRYAEGGRVFPPSNYIKSLVGDGCGVEIGAGACNPFGVNSIQIGLTEEVDPEDYNNYKQGQIANCGDYARIDASGEATRLPLFDSSVDFVLTSHVWEHIPNPLKALDEWVRVVKDGGTIVAIVPLRDAHWGDVGRPVTTLSQLLEYYKTNPSIADFPNTVEHRGHCIIFSMDLLLQIMLWFNTHNHSRGVTLTVRSLMENDDKVGNGHLVVWRVNKQDNRDSKEIATFIL